MNVAKTLVAGLSLLALQSSTIPNVADAAPKLPGQGSTMPRVNPGSLPQHVINGRVEVDPGCASEFPHWTSKLEFYDRPDRVCVRWLDKKPVGWARWELYKDNPSSPNDMKIASGLLSSGSLSGTSASFQIKLDNLLPLHNGGKSDQKYFVRIQSKLDDEPKAMSANAATLVHKPKAGEPVPPQANPYSCGSSPDNYKRKVVLELPKMTVNQTTNTSGDGDRDELYISIGQLGPGTTSKQKRLPSADDYYEAKNGKTVSASGWTNQDETHVASPVLFNGTISHGQVVDLAIAAQEQDNSDLKDAKAGLIDAMHAVAAVATAVGGYGLIVAAVAEGVAGAAQFIPNTKNHDFIGFVGVRLTNKCGRVQTAWTTFESKKISGVGTITNQFLDVTTHDGFESRLAVMAESQFWPDGVDWGGYEYVGMSDEFWWIANGTSNAKYTFLLRSKMLPPS
ncbi:MAG TPA: hypothetical protein VG755_42005 [Nannocystaceae bacterium]|nr:hypothetical protein [Nannocystaceae bacterium]